LRKTQVRLEEFYNALTFHDLILFATQAVRENPELVADTLYIIDEFQDFNLAEDGLIREITTESPAQLLVGDDDQVLYHKLKEAHPDILRGYYKDSSFVNAMLPSAVDAASTFARPQRRFWRASVLTTQSRTWSAFFVVLTRVRKSLTLMTCVGGGGANVLHDFICFLPDEHAEVLYMKVGGSETRESIRDLQAQLEKWAYQRKKARMRPRARRS
jgi:hypothetical protein